MNGFAGFDFVEIFLRIFKYFFEGIVIAIAAFFIPGKKMKFEEIMMIALVGAATFSLLDLFAPSVGSSARMGAGFGIGTSLVGGVATTA